jgi:hypothetical protein
MKAVLCQQARRPRIVERPPPAAPAPGWVRLAVSHVGICGTDYHIFEGKHPFLEYPRVMGHEISATVIEAGDGVTLLAVGTPVIVNPYLSCGTCVACRQGQAELLHQSRCSASIPTAPSARKSRFPPAISIRGGIEPGGGGNRRIPGDRRACRAPRWRLPGARAGHRRRTDRPRGGDLLAHRRASGDACSTPAPSGWRWPRSASASHPASLPGTTTRRGGEGEDRWRRLRRRLRCHGLRPLDGKILQLRRPWRRAGSGQRRQGRHPLFRPGIPQARNDAGRQPQRDAASISSMWRPRSPTASCRSTN